MHQGSTGIFSTPEKIVSHNKIIKFRLGYQWPTSSDVFSSRIFPMRTRRKSLLIIHAAYWQASVILNQVLKNDKNEKPYQSSTDLRNGTENTTAL